MSGIWTPGQQLAQPQQIGWAFDVHADSTVTVRVPPITVIGPMTAEELKQLAGIMDQVAEKAIARRIPVESNGAGVIQSG